MESFKTKVSEKWASFKTWWGGSKLWQKVAVVIGVLFVLNILLGACAGPRSGQAQYNNQQPMQNGNGQTTVIYRDSGSSFWGTMGGFLGGYWLGSRNRGYDNYNQPYYNNGSNYNNDRNNNNSKPIQDIQPSKPNTYTPSKPSTPSTVTPKNEYKPSTPSTPAPKVEQKPSTNTYKPSAPAPSKPSGGSSNTYKPKN